MNDLRSRKTNLILIQAEVYKILLKDFYTVSKYIDYENLVKLVLTSPSQHRYKNIAMLKERILDHDNPARHNQLVAYLL